jgi:hypothetical protein
MALTTAARRCADFFTESRTACRFVFSTPATTHRSPGGPKEHHAHPTPHAPRRAPGGAPRHTPRRQPTPPPTAHPVDPRSTTLCPPCPPHPPRATPRTGRGTTSHARWRRTNDDAPCRASSYTLPPAPAPAACPDRGSPRSSRTGQRGKDSPTAHPVAPKEHHAMSDIPIPRATLERLLVVLTKQYERQPTREVKQATDTLRTLLGHAA